MAEVLLDPYSEIQRLVQQQQAEQAGKEATRMERGHARELMSLAGRAPAAEAAIARNAMMTQALAAQGQGSLGSLRSISPASRGFVAPVAEQIGRSAAERIGATVAFTQAEAHQAAGELRRMANYLSTIGAQDQAAQAFWQAQMIEDQAKMAATMQYLGRSSSAAGAALASAYRPTSGGATEGAVESTDINKPSGGYASPGGSYYG